MLNLLNRLIKCKEEFYINHPILGCLYDTLIFTLYVITISVFFSACVSTRILSYFGLL